jgi:hypothetical protein
LTDRSAVAAAALGAVFAGLISAAGLAQESAGSGEPPRVVLGTVSSDRGATASVPLFYQPAAGRPIRTLHLEVKFAGDSVRFVRAQKGPASESQDFDLTATAREGRLSVDVSVRDPDARKALPDGVMASLDFQVPEDATAGSVPLVPIAVSALDGSSNQVKAIAEEGMIVIVSAPPVAGLF